MSDAGVVKAAILMLALGRDEAAEVMKHLGPKEVTKLGNAMATMKQIANEQIDDVLTEFCRETERTSNLGVDSDDYIRQVLTKALGDDKATVLLNRILGNKDASGIDSLKWMDAQSIADLIHNEHPQVIATILVHLERFHASEVLNQFTERLRNDVVLRIANLDGVQPAALRELNEVLTKLLSGNEHVKRQTLGGVRATAEILNFFSGDNESSVMEMLKNHDGDMAQKIMDEMFVFENILEIDNKGIQLLLREVQADSLIIALKGASQEMREKIFSNMSERAAENLRDDLDSKGPVRLSEVEAQQKEILQIVRRLADEGQIILSGGDDEFV
jgi:flagellar motor switch protein FliG